MSFITKRERVFNELDLYDLPARNEGKLKAYASCTDARAWSHFNTSKTEHLTELIKRNNDVSCPGKYVPTKVIVDTIMVSKNMEIARLRRKIDEFEQMLAVYEELELDCDQKCEIAKAHAAIKSANKDLDELCLNLDSSTFTDGFETESFETGKSRSTQYSIDASIKSRGAESDRSRGDAQWTVMSQEKQVTNTQANQTSLVCPCDVSVSVHDPRIEEMQDEIIAKDAKLNAMHNSLAIMENDICEPFGIYAHIYIALEKIYGILSQNSKYKQYLNLMTAGKDIRCIDIKGKILFKMKVLEKFCLALIAPCSQEFSCSNNRDCPCYRVDLKPSVSLAYHIEPEECASSHSAKRSQLVADIMEHEEMKEILSKESTPDKTDDSEIEKVSDTAVVINEENQKRLKDLQACYDDLLNCYENSKHEADCLRVRCAKYDDLELELERLRGQLHEYNALWNEKEHYRKRSEDLDSLKHQYIVLAEESSGLESKLKAEAEINNIKTDTIEELRDRNLYLEKRLNDLYISFEKEKNNLQIQLQESQCKCMCQEQQIKTLSTQIVQLLEQDPENIPEDTARRLLLTQENEILKDQLKHYQEIEQEFQDKLALVNELEKKIADWTAAYKEVAERNRYLEDRIESYNKEKNKLLNENRQLLDNIRDKSDAVANLMEMIKNKAMEINKLSHENENYSKELETLGEKYENLVNMSQLENQELLRKVDDYDAILEKQKILTNALQEKNHEYEDLKMRLKQTEEENEKLKNDLNALLLEDAQNKKSIEITRRESSLMTQKILELENVSQQFVILQDAFEKLTAEKNAIENELRKKASQLDSAMYSIKLNRKESGELLQQSESIKNELATLNFLNQRAFGDNEALKRDVERLQEENKVLRNKCARLSALEQELSDLKKAFDELKKEKVELEQGLETKNQECSNLSNILESKIGENKSLNDNLKSLEKENKRNLIELNTVKEETSALIERLQSHGALENEYDELKSDHDNVKSEKERLQRELQARLSDLQKLEQEKSELQNRTDDLLAHNNDLEKTLMNTRNELLSAQSIPPEKTPHGNLMEEIKKMKIEKAAGQEKIRELLDRLDESEQVIATYKEDVNERDHRIATMQNHINNLEDEVRKLEALLERAVEAGFDIHNTNQSIDLARRQIDAHHSKASHNIKLELAMLQQSNSKLENELSFTKSMNELSSKDKQKYLSEINDLKNEREIIVEDIIQLEIHSAGDSELTPEQCELNCILNSLHRIREAFNTRHSKTVSLEQTLAKVNASSQLILNKADETKRHFENEKQKIINEKEEALKEKKVKEKQLNDLKQELERQMSRDADVIKNLEAKNLNNELIIDKINDSNKSNITKLDDEIKTLQDLYKNAKSRISELQERFTSCTTDKDQKEEIIRNLMLDLEKKSKEITDLQSEFGVLLEKSKQVEPKQVPKQYKDISSQTHDITRPAFIDQREVGVLLEKTKQAEPKQVPKQYKDISSQTHDITIPAFIDQRESDKSDDKVDKLQANQSEIRDYINEVHILPVELEPTFDFVRSSYLNYKLKRLSHGVLEHHSIPSVSDGTSSHFDKPETSSNFLHGLNSDSYKFQYAKTRSSNEDLVDIYQNPSNDVNNSSQIIEVKTQKQKSATGGKISYNVSSQVKSDMKVSEKVKRIGDHIDKQNTSLSTTDVVVIFKDNEKSSKEKTGPQKTYKQKLRTYEKMMNVDKSHDRNWSSPKSNAKNNNEISPLYIKERKPNDTKRKISINLLRVNVDSHSYVTTDNEGNSSNSLTRDMYALPVKETLSDTMAMTSTGDDIYKFDTPSLPKISKDDNIYPDSRSFIDLPSKETSFNKNDQSGNTISNHKFGSKMNQPNDGNRGVRIKSKPQHLSVAENDPISDDSTARFKTSDQNKKRVDIIPHHNFSHDNRPFNSIGIDTKTKVEPSKIQQHNLDKSKNIGETSRLEPDEKTRTSADAGSKQNFTTNSANNADDIIRSFVNDLKNKEKTNRTSQQSLAGLGRHGKSYDQTGRNIDDEKSRAKKSIPSLDNVSQGGKFKSRESILKTGKLMQPEAVDQDSDINSDSNSEGHFLNDRQNKHNRSNIDLAQVGTDVFLNDNNRDDYRENNYKNPRNDFSFNYILDSVKSDYGDLSAPPSVTRNKPESVSEVEDILSKHVSQGVMVKLDTSAKYYENVIGTLRKSLENVEKEHKMQIEAIKIQYDKNINNIINEHNQGVKNIQSIHEDTLLDIMRVHENEVENLRSMSIEAMRKVEKLEKELYKSRISIDKPEQLDEVPTKFIAPKKATNKLQSETKVLTKTTIEAFNVKPKMRIHGPCTCSPDINLSDTIRNIFEQVDVEQRKMAELTYLKYIASKISNGHIESLDSQELSFLHLKVCRTWKLKLNKEEALQKKIDSLEVELINKQRTTQQHLLELDRKVAQERRRLEEVREAVCRSNPSNLLESRTAPIQMIPDSNCGNSCACNMTSHELTEAGDVVTAGPTGPMRMKKAKTENKGATTKPDLGERRERERRLYTDEPPVRLRRQQDRPPQRPAKK